MWSIGLKPVAQSCARLAGIDPEMIGKTWRGVALSLRGSGYNGTERRRFAGRISGDGCSAGVVLRPQGSSGKIMITLGINYLQMHDSSACIVRDGELLFAVAEERVSRVQHDAGFPRNAIRTFFSSGMDALVIGSFLVEK